MHRLIGLTVVLSLQFPLFGCGGGGSSTSAENSNAGNNEPGNTQSTEKTFLSAGIYPATNGSGYSDFHKLKLERGGYLDITTFKSTVALYSSSLELIDNELDSADYIGAGEYNIKFNYSPTSNIPGNVTIFSLELINYTDLPNIESKKYNASGSFGTYSEYYKLEMTSGSYIDITTTKSSVYVYNKTVFGNDGMPLASHYEQVENNKYLDAGEYIIKFTYEATSLTPGTVSFQKN